MKKGFTLIELLAVVIVIAIITLIAIPIIANVIESSKKGSALDSAYGYISALEKNIATGYLDSSKGITIPSDNNLDPSDENDALILGKINIKGQKPDYASVTFEKGKVKSAGFCINGYNIEYKDRKASISKMDYCSSAKVREIIISSPNITCENNQCNMVAGFGSQIELASFLSFDTVDGQTPDYNITSDNDDAVIISDGKIIATGIGEANVTIIAGIRVVTIAITSINDSVIGYIQGNKFDADNESCISATDASDREYMDCNVTISANGQEYPAHVYNYDGDLTISATTAIGSTDDIGAKMVVLKVNGNLTIDSGATLYPTYNSNGGPKGFTIFVTGTLTNNGSIQNLHGGRGDCQDVYLWQNADSSERGAYETVPGQGSAGGGSVTAGASSTIAGKAGTAGSGRSTGGGGGGAGRTYSNKGTGGPGGRGSSYSGGAGGGGGAGTSSKARTGGTGSSNGGAGGAGNWMGGGAGNPGGGGNGGGGTGTGGLIIIYTNNFVNNATIGVQGTVGGTAGDEKLTGGGGSGGGSINVFYNTVENIGTTNIDGGNGGAASKGKAGGRGGNGTATFGSVATGTFMPYQA